MSKFKELKERKEEVIDLLNNYNKNDVHKKLNVSLKTLNQFIDAYEIVYKKSNKRMKVKLEKEEKTKIIKMKEENNSILRDPENLIEIVRQRNKEFRLQQTISFIQNGCFL